MTQHHTDEVTAKFADDAPSGSTNAGLPQGDSDAASRESSGHGFGAGAHGLTALSEWAATQPLTSSHTDGPRLHALPQVPGFEVLARCGRGGMGEVYRAYDPRLRIEVALKLPRSLAPESRRIFLEEARHLAQVQHPNVVAIRSFGEAGQHVYFTMDMVNGLTLAELVPIFREQGAHRCSGPEVLVLAGVDQKAISPGLSACCLARRAYYHMIAHWFAEAAEGLAAAHDHGILHRDIKPGNLMLSKAGRLVVVDFGLAARPEEFRKAQQRGATGTYPYIPPERVLGDWSRVDHRADIWSLGATLYELLTYQRAYQGQNNEVLREIAVDDPPVPHRAMPCVPRGLEQICLRALARDPAQRFNTAHEMAAALRAWSQAQRSRPRRAAVTAGVAAAIALLAVTIPLAVGRKSESAKQAQKRQSALVTEAGEQEPERPSGQRAETLVLDQLAAFDEPASQPAASAPAAAEKPVTELPIADAVAPPAIRTCVLLALNEDLGPAQGGPRVSGNLERIVTATLKSAQIDVCAATAPDSAWTLADSVAAAREQGIAAVAYGALRARPVSSVRVSFQPEPVVTWRLELDMTLVRLSDKSEKHVSARPREVQPSAAGDDFPGRPADLELLVKDTINGQGVSESPVTILGEWLGVPPQPQQSLRTKRPSRTARGQ